MNNYIIAGLRNVYGSIARHKYVTKMFKTLKSAKKRKLNYNLC